jgi:hypothetical protein
MTEEGTGAAWFVNREFNMTVDFCVWVLEQDGLTVAPFDRHRGGTGEARARGLDADNWQAWLTGVVRESAHPFPMAQVLPPSTWGGEPAVGAVLASLWDQYLPLFNSRPGQELDSANTPQLDEARRFWDVLAPYRLRLPPLNLFFVGYAWPVEYLVPPMAAVLGVGDAASDTASDTSTERAVRIAEGLAQAAR